MMRSALLLTVLLASCSGTLGDGDEERGVDAAPVDDADAPVSDVADVTVDADADLPDTAEATGLRGEYFDDYDDPRVTRVDANVDFDWPTEKPVAGVPHDWFSARWSGELLVDAAETYTFETRSDDGVRLVIDGEKVIENWTGHFPTTNTGSIALSAGRHRIVLEYFQLDLGATIQLYWSSKTVARALVPTSALRPAKARSAARAPAPPYVNPVYAKDCPDPGVLRVEEEGRAAYYMSCTGGVFRVYRSRDLVRWAATSGAILPAGKAPWSANGGRNWAPELHAVGGKYVAYFTAVNAADKLAIGAASATSPVGPWTVSAAPLVDDPTPGVIDATFFRDDDGKQYLYWKRDGNAIGKPTPIFVRELRADGLGFAAGSAATQVLTNDPGSWEGGVVEAPWVVRRGGNVYMFYSGNVYDRRYRTGVARAGSPKGPFTKLGAPILANNAGFLGPGHGSVVRAHDADFFVYHAWINDGSGSPAPGGRQVLVDAITWAGGWPKIADGTPSIAPQPWP
ncbi:MAG: family 43 glycosylhydrolase [Deltaproteobacteria bacterium]|nr:family 43 glycosylhydrolase [Deltaproteobacteria bacterium]